MTDARGDGLGALPVQFVPVLVSAQTRYIWKNQTKDASHQEVHFCNGKTDCEHIISYRTSFISVSDFRCKNVRHFHHSRVGARTKSRKCARTLRKQSTRQFRTRSTSWRKTARRLQASWSKSWRSTGEVPRHVLTGVWKVSGFLQNLLSSREFCCGRNHLSMIPALDNDSYSFLPEKRVRTTCALEPKASASAASGCSCRSCFLSTSWPPAPPKIS